MSDSINSILSRIDEIEAQAADQRHAVPVAAYCALARAALEGQSTPLPGTILREVMSAVRNASDLVAWPR